MRGFRFTLALLATTVVLGCGATHRPGQAAPAVAPTAAKPAGHTLTAGQAAVPGSPSSTRLAAIAFTSRSTGYGIFTSRARGRCQALAGRTTDGGARFGPLAIVTAWRCEAYPPAVTLTADSLGDAFLYDPGLFVTHDGGRTWTNGHQPGVVMAIAAAGRSAWMLRADCPRHGGTCPLRLLVSRMSCHGGTPLDSGYLGQIDAVSADTAFLVGDRSSLLVTTDGGSRWRTVRPVIGDSGGGTAQVVFVGRRDGFVLGDDARRGERPAIWRTADGGAHWSAVVPRAG